MKRKINVAAIQMYIEPLNIKANFKKAESLLSKIIKKEKVDLVVYPEDCITGPIPYNLKLAKDTSQIIILFQNLAKKYNTYIVCGSFLKKVKNKYYNTSCLIEPQGKVILEYQKNNLWLSEQSYITPGSDINVIKTPIGTIGIIICWDLAFPEITTNLARLGADIICCPSYWTVDDGRKLHKKYGNETENIFVNTLCPARAIENECLFIYANGAGIAKVPLKDSMWTSDRIGQTQICIPIKGTVKKINTNKEGFITYEFERDIIKHAESNYKIRKDLKSKDFLQ
ncbi:MAG TPA: carbon-nitrogen hydrolase family protein [Candidatus Nitrosocosmicus sp.]|nr:carbon-nitrogen hydrolase family protein [Candidatus Nitrosocosmicus sp.]